MAPDKPSSSEDEHRVVSFRRGGVPVQHRPAPSPVEDLGKYERDDAEETREDYRHRMITNAVAFAFIVALIGAGLWLADTMAAMRKSQDCVLSGRRGCAPIEVPRDRF